MQHLRDGGRVECALPVAADAQDGAVGQAGLHPHPAALPLHEEAALPGRQAQVRAIAAWTGQLRQGNCDRLPFLFRR